MRRREFLALLATAPSIGFAWQPNDDGRSVVRGNYRIAYDRLNTFVLFFALYRSVVRDEPQ